MTDTLDSSNPFNSIGFKIPTPPTQEEIERRFTERYNNSLNSPNQFTYWFPTVMRVLDSSKFGVKYPKTKIHPLSQYATDVFMSEDPEKIENHAELKQISQWIKDTMTEFNTDQVFIKNSLYSGKHFWGETCFLTKDADVKKQVEAILHSWLLSSPEYATSMVVRELIKTAPAFYAFNQMPITQEFRLFSRDGLTHSYQPYWPELSIQDADCEDWKEKLQAIATPSNKLLETMIQTSNEITKELGGDWSVDFLIDENGDPWLIDMALTSDSYQSPERIVLSE